MPMEMVWFVDDKKHNIIIAFIYDIIKATVIKWIILMKPNDIRSIGWLNAADNSVNLVGVFEKHKEPEFVNITRDDFKKISGNNDLIIDKFIDTMKKEGRAPGVRIKSNENGYSGVKSIELSNYGPVGMGVVDVEFEFNVKENAFTTFDVKETPSKHNDDEVLLFLRSQQAIFQKDVLASISAYERVRENYTPEEVAMFESPKKQEEVVHKFLSSIDKYKTPLLPESELSEMSSQIVKTAHLGQLFTSNPENDNWYEINDIEYVKERADLSYKELVASKIGGGLMSHYRKEDNEYSLKSEDLINYINFGLAGVAMTLPENIEIDSKWLVPNDDMSELEVKTLISDFAKYISEEATQGMHERRLTNVAELTYKNSGLDPDNANTPEMKAPKI